MKASESKRPRGEQGRAAEGEILGVAGHDGQAVDLGRRRDPRLDRVVRVMGISSQKTNGVPLLLLALATTA